ncbi:MAG: TonB-dependent receptor [Pseudomonadota bacterium]
MLYHSGQYKAKPTRFRKTVLNTTLASLMLSSASMASAQEEPQSQPLQIAQAETTQAFAIAAQPLASALIELSEKTGISFAYTSIELEGTRSAGASGNLTERQALDAILLGTGIVATFTSSKTVTLSKQAIEPQESDKPLVLGTVKVTSELLDRSILESNNSVDIQDYDEVLRGNDVRINQAFNRSANITDLSGGQTTFNFSIRGISSSGVGGAGSEPLAAVQIDGALLTTQQLSRGYNSTFDVDSIEVLRGPQSTNLGRNSLAGAVVVNTKDPEFVQKTTAIASYAEFATYELGVANTGPMTDELAYRVTLNRFGTDGFLENTVIGIDDYNFQETDTARFKLLYQPENLPLEILLGYTSVKADSRNDSSTYEPEAEEYINRNPFLGGMETDQEVFTLDLSVELTDAWHLESVTTFNETVSRDVNSTFSTSLPEPGQEWIATADQEEINQELRLHYESSDLRGVVGFYYVDQTNTALREGVAVPNFDAALLGIPGFPAFDLAVTIDSPLELESQALYTEFDYDLNAKVTLTAGGRYEEATITSTSNDTLWFEFIGGVPGFDTPIADLSLTADEKTYVFLPTMGINYQLAATQSLGFTYSEGFRSGGISLNALTFQTTKYDPEFVKNYEFAYRSELKNGLLITSNLFYMDWTDMQTQDNSLINEGTFNAGEASSYGGELEMNWLKDNWDTFFNVGYAKTEFGDFLIGSESVDGNRFPGAPALTIAAGAYYALNDWVFGGEISHSGEAYVDAANETEIDALTLVNVTGAYYYQDVKFELFVNNVFDEIKTRGEDFISEGVVTNVLNAPRVFGLRVEYGFN